MENPTVSNQSFQAPLSDANVKNARRERNAIVPRAQAQRRRSAGATQAQRRRHTSEAQAQRRRSASAALARALLLLPLLVFFETPIDTQN